MMRRFGTFLWLLMFLGGVTASILYVQGFRFRSGSNELVSTGVLEISTLPEGALLFLNNDLGGASPQIFRGQNLNRTQIRITKSGFREFVANLEIDPKLITHLRNFVLMPTKVRPLELGAADQLLWDPERRGYIELLPGQKAFQVHDLLTERTVLQEFLQSWKTVRFLQNGNLQIVFADDTILEQDFFSNRLFNSWESIAAERLFSPQKDQLLSVRGNKLYAKDVSTGRAELLFESTDAILDSWWLEESDDVLIVTRKQILFWNSSLRTTRTFFTPPVEIEESFALPEKSMIIYRNSERWFSLNFGLDMRFSEAEGIR